MLVEIVNAAQSQLMTVVQIPVNATTSAYLDPGTGSLVIQMAIGVVAGGLVGLKLMWKRIGAYFKADRSPERDQPEH